MERRSASPEMPAFRLVDALSPAPHAEWGFTDDIEHVSFFADKLAKDSNITVGFYPFGGPIALMANAGIPGSAEKINRIKGYTEEEASKKQVALVLDPRPEYLEEFVDTSRLPSGFSLESISETYGGVYGCGIVLPARPETQVAGNDTHLIIWTSDFEPLQTLYDEFRTSGGRALLGTSANQRGGGTHHNPHELYLDFKHIPDINYYFQERESAVPEERKKSTTIIDMAHLHHGEFPVITRAGNVSTDEVNDALSIANLPRAVISDSVRVMTKR